MSQIFLNAAAFVATGAVVVGVVLLINALLARRNAAAKPEIGPYNEIKKTIIDAHAASEPDDTLPPTRPADLDTRLDSALIEQLDTVDPTRFNAYEILSSVMKSIYAELDAIGADEAGVDLLDEPRRVVYITYWVEAEINNGGLSQYYLNSAGNHAAIAPDILRDLNLPEFADIIEQANAFFPDAHPPRDRSQRLDMLEEVEERAADTWSELGSAFYASGLDCQSALITHIRNYKPAFFKID